MIHRGSAGALIYVLREHNLFGDGTNANFIIFFS